MLRRRATEEWPGGKDSVSLTLQLLFSVLAALSRPVPMGQKVRRYPESCRRDKSLCPCPESALGRLLIPQLVILPNYALRKIRLILTIFHLALRRFKNYRQGKKVFLN